MQITTEKKQWVQSYIKCKRDWYATLPHTISKFVKYFTDKRAQIWGNSLKSNGQKEKKMERLPRLLPKSSYRLLFCPYQKNIQVYEKPQQYWVIKAAASCEGMETCYYFIHSTHLFPAYYLVSTTKRKNIQQR